MKVYEIKFEWDHSHSDREVYSLGLYKSKKRAKKRIKKFIKRHNYNTSLKTYIFKRKVR